MSIDASRSSDRRPDGRSNGQGAAPAPETKNEPDKGSQGGERSEVSGLHDIRALAKSAIQRASKQMDVADEAMLATSHSTLERVVLPEPEKQVAAPAERAPAARGGWVLPLVIGGIVVAAAGGVAAYVLVKRNHPAPVASAQAPTPPVTPAAGAPTDEKPAQAGVTVEPIPVKPAQVEPITPPATPEKKDEAGKPVTAKTEGATKREDKSSRTEDKPKGDGTKPAAATTATVAKPADKPSGDLDSLLDQAVGAPPPTKSAATPDKPAADTAAPSLPTALSREDVRQGMGTVRARVQGCYDRFKVPGTVTIRLRIEPSGSVSSAEAVDAKFKGTETGECVADAVRSAHFRQFGGAAMTINSYPFRLE